MAAKKKKMTMSDDHKAALAEGRQQGRSVRAYLEALDQHRPKSGRRRTPDSINKRLAAVDVALGSADPLRRLVLVQERLDLEAELVTVGESFDLAPLEAAFIADAGPYAERKGLSYAAFRAVGVTPAVLSKAGIKRGA
jgi:hypothetical protein